MQKWEYKVFHFSTHEYTDKADMALQQSLNQLGQDGWELITCVDYGGVLIYTLRRPKP